MKVRDYLIGLSKVVSGLIGNQLSLSKGKDPRPSVFIVRKRPNKPDYPYVTCDYVGLGDFGLKPLHSFLNDEGQLETQFNRRLRLRVAFYGQYENDILSICQELKDRLYSQKGKDLLETYMKGAGVTFVSEPQFVSNVLSTDFEEFCFIIIDFWYISKVVEDFESIDEAQVDGNLFVDFDQEEQPITITTDLNFNNQE